jgi:thymidylate synthase
MAILQLYGKAIEHLLEGRVPNDFPWQGEKIKALQESFTKDSHNSRYRSDAGDEKHFDYTYPELLTYQVYYDPKVRDNVSYLDQMEAARRNLKNAIEADMFDTRNVGNLFEPFFTYKENKPCFTVFMVQHTGDGKVTLILVFRSHDYGGAVWGNLAAIPHWFNEEVINPAGGELDEIIVFSASAHVYRDSDVIEKLLRHGYMSRFL